MSRKLIIGLSILMGFTSVWLIILQVSWFNSALELREQQFNHSVNTSLYQTVKDIEAEETFKELCSETNVFYTDSLYSNYAPNLNRPPHEYVDSVKLDTTKVMIISHGQNFYAVNDSTNNNFIRDEQPMSRKQAVEEIKKHIHDKTIFVDNIVNRLKTKRINDENRVNPSYINKLLNKNLRSSGILNDYEFCVRDNEGKIFFNTEFFFTGKASQVYEIELYPNDIISSNIYLSIIFPDENKSLALSLPAMAYTSVFLTLIIMLVFAATLIIIFKQKKLSEMKTDFVNNMTHELKTPVSTISLALQMLGDKSVPKSGPMYDHIFSILCDESKRLGFQIERVLQTAVIERGRVILKRKQLKMNTLIENVVNTFELKIKERQGVINCDFQADNDVIAGDEVHITNLIFNLLDNALKYTEDNPVLTVGTRNINNGLEFYVGDNGIGISKENQKSIFNQFFRVHTGNIHNVRGFGIGLSYVKKIVEEHKGVVSLKSDLGKGTIFYVYLPFDK